jgi:hypothetical protein
MQQSEYIPEKITGARADRRELDKMLGKSAPAPWRREFGAHHLRSIRHR